MLQIGVFIGPVLTVFLSVFGFTSRYSDIPSYFHALYEISYFRAAFQGSFYSLYGFNRSTLVCPEFYCHFRYPPKFLQEMQFDHVDITFDINYILLCGVLFYLLTVYSIWFKLNKRWGLFILERYQYFWSLCPHRLKTWKCSVDTVTNGIEITVQTAGFVTNMCWKICADFNQIKWF